MVSLSNAKIHMKILLQPNVEEAVVFYKKLGLPLHFHLKDKWAEFRIGSVKLGLCPTSAPKMDMHTGVVLEVADVQKTCDEFEKQGIELANKPVVQPHGVMASFKDPGGNIIDLYQPTPEKVKDVVRQVQEAEADACCGAEKSCCKQDELN